MGRLEVVVEGIHGDVFILDKRSGEYARYCGEVGFTAHINRLVVHCGQHPSDTPAKDRLRELEDQIQVGGPSFAS